MLFSSTIIGAILIGAVFAQQQIPTNNNKGIEQGQPDRHRHRHRHDRPRRCHCSFSSDSHSHSHSHSHGHRGDEPGKLLQKRSVEGAKNVQWGRHYGHGGFGRWGHGRGGFGRWGGGFRGYHPWHRYY